MKLPAEINDFMFSILYSDGTPLDLKRQAKHTGINTDLIVWCWWANSEEEALNNFDRNYDRHLGWMPWEQVLDLGLVAVCETKTGRK